MSSLAEEEAENAANVAQESREQQQASKSKNKKKKRSTVASRLEDLRKEHEKLRAKFLQSARKNQSLESSLSKKSREVAKLEAAVGAERQSNEKLSGLCRALQKEGELLRKQQSQNDAQAESKRQEIQESLSKIQADIDRQVADGAHARKKLAEENETLRGQLKGFLERYDKFQEHSANELRAKDLEKQLAEAKGAQELLLVKQEKAAAEKRAAVAEASELETRKSLTEALKRFEDFDSVVKRSSESLKTMQERLEERTKANIEFKKVINELRAALALVTHERDGEREKAATLQRQVDSLSRLCRTLTAARASGSSEKAEDQGDDEVVVKEGEKEAGEEAQAAGAESEGGEGEQ